MPFIRYSLTDKIKYNPKDRLDVIRKFTEICLTKDRVCSQKQLTEHTCELTLSGSLLFVGHMQTMMEELKEKFKNVEITMIGHGA